MTQQKGDLMLQNEKKRNNLMDALVSQFLKNLNKGNFSPYYMIQPNENKVPHNMLSDLPLLHDIEFFRRLRPSPLG